MRGWERGPAVLLGRCRMWQKGNRVWMLLLMAVGLLLCWDASTFRAGCSTDEGCGGLFSNVKITHARGFTGGDHIQHGTVEKNGLEPFKKKKVIAADEDDPKLYKKHVKTFNPRKNYPREGASQVHVNGAKGTSRDVVVQAAVSFNESVLLILNPRLLDIVDATLGNPNGQLKCVFSGSVYTNVLSAEHGFISCEHPPSLSGRSLNGSSLTVEIDGKHQSSDAVYGKISWRKVVYGLVLLEDEGDALLLVKGLVHNKKGTLPEGLQCQYGDRIKTEVVAFCQENIRCRLPPLHSRSGLVGKAVTLILKEKPFPSAVRFYPQKVSNSIMSLNSSKSSRTKLVAESSSQWRLHEQEKRYHLCACTMVWNGAKFLREWVIYHSHMGVQKFFLYDNNSDDDLPSVCESLESYNVSRHSWPWIKTQEAGFSHCSIRAASECAWVAFVDLDEFIFPKQFILPMANATLGPPLHALIKQYDAADLGRLGQLKISNFNFGPSGLERLPKSGQMVNYICRMSAPKRVKSIVRTVAINATYCSRVHHFELNQGFVSARAFRGDVVIQHYKYQVWEDFKMKFVRRVATFVTDWQVKKDLDSFDRTPGLGTEAMEPPNWAHQFCEIEDTELRDYVLNSSQLQLAGTLLWE